MAFTYPPSTGDNNLDSLSDVVIASPTPDQVLTYDGANWVNSTPANPDKAQDDLTDTIITTPQRGQAIRYNGTSFVNSDVNKILVTPTVPNNLWYTPKGNKNDAFNYFDPNNCAAFDLMFDTAMWFTEFGVIAKNFPAEGWTGGGARVWVFNSDATGKPTTLYKELGILDIPAAGTAPFSFMASHISDTITGGLYLEANTRYWIATSTGTGPVEGTYGSGTGPDLYQVKGLSDAWANNIPSGDSNFYFGADNSSMFIGTLQAAGGINAVTNPTTAGTLYEDLNSTNGAICVVLKGGRD